MLIKGIFTAISGSIGGVTGSHNKGGQYLRARTVPVNPNSLAQQRARADFTTAITGWGALSDAQRAAWNTFAGEQSWTNRLGDAMQLSGQQAYIACNSKILAAGLAVTNVPPVPNTMPAIPLFTATAVLGDDPVVTIVVTSALATAADRWIVQMGRKIGPGVTAYKGPWRIVLATSAAFDDASASYYNSYTTGDRIPVRVCQVNADGTFSQATDAVVEVTAV